MLSLTLNRLFCFAADLWLRGPPHAPVQTADGEPQFLALLLTFFSVVLPSAFEPVGLLCSTCPDPLPSLQPSLQDYYGITFPGPTATLSGRDGSLANNPYSGKAPSLAAGLI